MFHELHELIQSFTQKEINKLDHFVHNSNGKTEYQYQLFSCLYEMGEEFQQDMLDWLEEKHQVKTEVLRVTSYKLYNHIMLYLRDPKVRPNPTWEVQCLIQDAQILRLKGLHFLSLKKLGQALEIVEQAQFPELKYQVHLEYCSSLVNQKDSNLLKEVEEHFQAAQTAWLNTTQSEEIIQENVSVFLQWLVKTKKDENKKPPPPINDDLEIPAHLSFYAKLRYAQTQGMIAQAHDEQELILQWLQKSMDLFTDERLKSQYPFHYFKTIANYQNALFLNKKWDSYLTLLNEVMSFKSDQPLLQSFLGHLVALMQLNYWVNHPEVLIEVDEDELSDIIDQVENSNAATSVSQVTAIVNNLAFAYFLRGNHFNARFYWKSIKIGRKNPLRPDLQRFISMFSLINDLMDPSYGQEEFLSTVNTIRNRLNNLDENAKGLLGHEKIAIKYIRKLSNCPPTDKRKKRKILHDFYDKLVEYQKEGEDGAFMRSDPIIWWLKQELGL